MTRSLFLPFSYLEEMSFFIRWLGHCIALLAFVAYQSLFPHFVTPNLVFSVYGVCSVVFLIDVLVLFLSGTYSNRLDSKYLFFLDSLFLFAFILLIGVEGIYIFLFLSFLQILALSFHQDKLVLLQFTLWTSCLFSIGFFHNKGDLLLETKEVIFLTSNFCLIVSFITGNAFVDFLKNMTGILNQDNTLTPHSWGQKSKSSLFVALRLSNKFKPALNSLLDLFDSFLTKKGDFPKGKEDVFYRIKQINKLQDVIKKLEELENIKILAFNPINVNELIQKSIQNLMAHSERPSFLKETLELYSEGWVEGSHSHLERALSEIFINGFQALKKVENPEIHIKTYNKDNKMFVEILDNGAGVAREDMPHIKEPFFSKRLGKSGLGLSFAFKIIEAHKGVLEFNNTEKGFKVSITLPLLSGQAPSENKLIA